ncbi:hypothetical protein FB45DRAFT_1112892 [Roridomyces roridus]|uniref:Transmembrane protein n=1 Tax=Roridomyces roridus TaxID=1738132 RepID=A0AAD7FB02_9AGAR|nr:hypothetical protein FB45DRAFT_1112892 [Roridomyces roridus]
MRLSTPKVLYTSFAFYTAVTSAQMPLLGEPASVVTLIETATQAIEFRPPGAIADLTLLQEIFETVIVSAFTESSTVQPITSPTNSSSSSSTPFIVPVATTPSLAQMTQKRALIIVLFAGSLIFALTISLVAKHLISQERRSAARRDIEAALAPDLAEDGPKPEVVVDRRRTSQPPAYPWKSMEASARRSSDSEFVASEDCPPPRYTVVEHSP